MARRLRGLTRMAVVRPVLPRTTSARLDRQNRPRRRASRRSNAGATGRFCRSRKARASARDPSRLFRRRPGRVGCPVLTSGAAGSTASFFAATKADHLHQRVIMTGSRRSWAKLVETGGSARAKFAGARVEVLALASGQGRRARARSTQNRGERLPLDHRNTAARPASASTARPSSSTAPGERSPCFLSPA